ncbi:unnamed protein product [Larinioides sclopetarius]|uniref:Cystatin domain-containing protein n=1 Tax=Larinioides sclopetarius TaxID=280406 RepID=A0AAV2BN97_9ARAC
MYKILSHSLKNYSFVERPEKNKSSKMLKVIVLFSILALSCALLVARATVDPNDEEVVTAANEAAKVLSKQFSGKYHHRLARVLKARKQDFSGGIDFQIDIVVGQTSCRKDEYEFENTDECDFRTGISVFKKCTVNVFRDADGTHKSLSPTYAKSLGNFTCALISPPKLMYIILSYSLKKYSFFERPEKNNPSKMLKVTVLFSILALSCALLVARATVDPDDEVVIAAKEAAKVLSKQFSGKYLHRLFRILTATKEDVAGGIDFQMEILVGQTSCLKDEYEFRNTDECTFRMGKSVFKKCTVNVFRAADGTHKVGAKGCILF